MATLGEVIGNAARLASPGKGILASDESTGTVGKRLKGVGLENTVEMRQAYREVLYTVPGIGEYFSGVIMYEETLYQSTRGGVPFVEVLRQQGILPGIKADQGLVVLAGTDGESTVQGLDDLNARCVRYYKQGARFAKWRAVVKISDKCPSALAIAHTAEGLACYAAIAQQNGLVPIVEPEILIDGTHSIERSAQVAEEVFAAVICALHRHRVCLEGILLKPQMILPGFDCPQKVTPEECAAATIKTLQRCIPAAVPGIMFLSGGQSEEEATVHLQALNELKQRLGTKAPWALSFSFGRALQGSVLRIWAENEANKEAAQRMGLAIARVNAEATLGRYSSGKDGHPSTCNDDLREGFRGWSAAPS
eukprot:TRINITY_DN36559_c0_g1_i1.p1 TRINITY_DN36559_c0_g1~~TRINITY_DN36559_c0_g1_i1.p1  ORF type:complete len:365 (-),score=51.39 TRINITY_DN36559_c0_g1_i1:253-1347(-)